MAIKGGLLDCEGQMEIEENLNRLQERYGSYELGEKFVCEDFGGTYIITSEDVGNDYIEGSDRLDLSEIKSDAELPCVTTIVINGADCKVVRKEDAEYITYYLDDNSDIASIKQITTADSPTSFYFRSAITEDMIGKQYVFAAYERPIINIHPMDPLLHYKGEYVGDLTSTDPEDIQAIVRKLISSLEGAGYLKRAYEQ